MGRHILTQDGTRFLLFYFWSQQDLKMAQYEFERRKYAQDLIAFDKQFSALFSGKPKTTDQEDGITHDEFFR